MENMTESMDEIMIHYAVIMFDEWDHPASGQVDKWVSS
jgi:hypothetical protein